jgi:hypothetical protein
MKSTIMNALRLEPRMGFSQKVQRPARARRDFGYWRRVPESNQHARLCRPRHHHSATPPLNATLNRGSAVPRIQRVIALLSFEPIFQFAAGPEAPLLGKMIGGDLNALAALIGTFPVFEVGRLRWGIEAGGSPGIAIQRPALFARAWPPS